MTTTIVQTAGGPEAGGTAVVQTAGRDRMSRGTKLKLLGFSTLGALSCVLPGLATPNPEQSQAPNNSSEAIDLQACIYSIDSVKKISVNTSGVSESDIELIAEYNVSLANTLGLPIPETGTEIETSIFQHSGKNGNEGQGGVEIAISGVPLGGSNELGYSTYVSFKDEGGTIKSFMFNIKDPNDVDVQNIDGNTLVTFQGRSLDPQNTNPANFMALVLTGTFTPEQVTQMLLDKDFSMLTEFTVANPLTGVCCVSNLQADQQNAGSDFLGSAVKLVSLDTDAGPVIPTTPMSPTPTPPTEIPVITYTAEQLAAMNMEQKLAAAPESTEGYSKSLYREAPNLVFYQNAELDVVSAYDLTTGISYNSPETIPLPPIQTTVSRDILGANIQETIGNVANVKDTVFAGEEPFYRLRVLQDYKDGLIPNIPASVQPPMLYVDDLYTSISGVNIFKANPRDPNMVDLEKRPYRDVTIVQDGEGGVRFIQVWRQQDGSVDISWYHLTQKAISANGAGTDAFTMESILKSMFDNISFVIAPIRDYKNEQSCFALLQDATFCSNYTNPDVRTSRFQAIDSWKTTQMIPSGIRNGKIQFTMIGVGW